MNEPLAPHQREWLAPMRQSSKNVHWNSLVYLRLPSSTRPAANVLSAASFFGVDHVHIYGNREPHNDRDDV